MFLTIIVVCALFSYPALAAESGLNALLPTANDTQWEITATEKLEFIEKDGLVTAEGDVLITKGNLSLSAQKTSYNRNTGAVEASGDICFDNGEDSFMGESGSFNLNDQTGRITKGRLFLKENNYYISGELIEKSGENTFLVRDFRLTTCDETDPTWSITGSEVKVTLEGYGKIKGAAFRVREVPLLYLPYMIFPAKTKRQTGLLLPSVGYSDRNGMELEVPFFWAISDQMDATLYERLISRRGLMQGIEFRYVAEGDSEGTYLFDILRDRIERKDMNNPEHTDLSPFPRTNRTRYWLRSRTDQELPAGIRARLDTDILSDQDYLREFGDGLFGLEARPDLADVSGRPVDEITSPVRRSALRISRDNEGYSLQALASYYQRPEGFEYDQTAQPLAGIDFTILPRSLLRLPMAFSLDTDLNYIWRDFGKRGYSVSITPALTYPLRFGRYLEFEPSVSVTRNMRWTSDDLHNNDTLSENVYQFQARLSTIMERIFDIDWKHTERLKHKLVPSLLYEYRSRKDKINYPPWFDPIDALEETKAITMSIDNFIDAKNHDSEGNITYSRWADLNLSQGYDLDESRLEQLTGTLILTPFPDLDLDAEVRWDHHKDEISFADLSLEYDMERSGGRKDTYRIDYVYLDGLNKGLSYYLNVNMPYGFSAGSSLQRDMDLRHNIENSYWIEYLAQCWGARLTVERFDEESSIMLTFRLLGLGGD
ncbi:MAG TPA: LPS assembly protein LptD [Desulfatiglandales bacterium]|nr:LPS assembly protein LptD [Desulfatiglandales bacterium]